MSGDEDTEVFEITDFTTASEWERFIARFEEILHEWKLVSTRTRRPVTKEEQLNGVWVEKKESLSFSDFQFVLSHHYLKPAIDETMETKDNVDEDNDEDEEKEDVIPLVMMDLMNTENDFPAKAHNLCRVYGLHDFVVLAPSTNSDAIDSESRIKLLLSSVSIGLNNTRCITPVFIHIKEHWRQMYTGVCMPPGALLEFDVLHLNKTPSQYNHLAGLLDVFKAKLCTHVSPRPTVNVAVRFTFFLQDWVNSPWPQEPPDFSSVMEDKVGVSSIGCLPFGATEDPVSELRLACTWPSLSEDMIVENQNYSDLDPLQAPQWSVKINMSEDPSCLLGEYLRSFVKHGNRRESAEDLLFNMVALNDDDEQTDITQALSRLTEPKVPYSLPSLSHVKVRSGRRVSVKNGDSPLSPDVLKKVLEFLFPDAKDPINKARELYTAEDEKDEDVTESDPPKDNRYTDILKDLSKQMKSAPVDSIIHKLAVCLCMVNMAHGGLRGVAQLWQEFVLEMRYRLENNFFIKGVQPGSPNLGSCLLYQKLQMLNCCIERKIKRDQLFKGYTGEKEYSRSDEDVEESDLSQNDHLQEKRQKFAEKTRFSQSLDSKRVVKEKNSNTSTSKSKSSECLSSSSSSSKISSKVDNSLTTKKDKSQTSGSSAKKDSQQSCDSMDTVGAQKGKSSQKSEKASEGETECQTEKSLKRGDKSWKSLDVCSSSEDEFFECDDSIDVENDDKVSDERDDGDEDGDSDMEDEDRDIECKTEDMDSRDGDKADDEEDEVIEISDEDSKEESEGEENRVHDDDDDEEEEEEDEDDSCDEQESTTLKGEKDATEDSSQESMETSFHESLSHRPEGRLAPFNDEKLLETGEQMYIPMTQEPAPMTEDMLEEHAEILAKLGTSSEGAQIRARMQSACLVSDMESFKAANPGCTLEDFVRWYSPRDWVEEETVDDNGQTVKGHLSQRMMIPGNIWVDAWQGAKPVPARRQKRLFDDTKEAEKVLHFLSSMKPAHLVLNVMPSLIHAAIIKVVDNEDPDIPHLKDAIDQLVRKAAKLTRSMPQNIKKFEDLVRLITLAETMIARAKSLKDKFSKDLLDQKNAEKELEQFVADLLHHQEVVVRGGPYGPAGSIIHKLFVAAQKEINMVMGDEGEEDSNSSTISDFPKPTGREYILRTFAPRPAPYSKSLPQRMYCNITEGHEFRLAGAFASDTVFQ